MKNLKATEPKVASFFEKENDPNSIKKAFDIIFKSVVYLN